MRPYREVRSKRRGRVPKEPSTHGGRNSADAGKWKVDRNNSSPTKGRPFASSRRAASLVSAGSSRHRPDLTRFAAFEVTWKSYRSDDERNPCTEALPRLRRSAISPRRLAGRRETSLGGWTVEAPGPVKGRGERLALVECPTAPNGTRRSTLKLWTLVSMSAASLARTLHSCRSAAGMLGFSASRRRMIQRKSGCKTEPDRNTQSSTADLSRCLVNHSPSALVMGFKPGADVVRPPASTRGTAHPKLLAAALEVHERDSRPCSSNTSNHSTGGAGSMRAKTLAT